MKKFIPIVIILFGIFATACGGFWETAFLLDIIGQMIHLGSATQNLLMLFMPIISMIVGGGIIWISGKKVDFSWITKGWRIFFIALYICAGIFQIFLVFLLTSMH